jgi:hypothetical protein
MEVLRPSEASCGCFRGDCARVEEEFAKNRGKFSLCYDEEEPESKNKIF